MQIDFSRKLYNYDGSPIKLNAHDEDAATLGQIVCHALMSSTDKPTGDVKLKRYLLAQRIHEEGVGDLTVEQIAEIKKLVADFNTPVVGAVYQMLDPAPPRPLGAQA